MYHLKLHMQIFFFPLALVPSVSIWLQPYTAGQQSDLPELSHRDAGGAPLAKGRDCNSGATFQALETCSEANWWDECWPWVTAPLICRFYL